jgi:histidyl-tRNA synthetase
VLYFTLFLLTSDVNSVSLARLRDEQGGSIKQPNVDVVIASVGDGMLKERMKIAKMLWDAKISSEYSQQENPKLNAQLRNALDRNIPFMVIIGEQELAENKCNVKDLKASTEDTVPIADLVKTLRMKGAIPVGCEFAAELAIKEAEEKKL